MVALTSIASTPATDLPTWLRVAAPRLLEVLFVDRILGSPEESLALSGCCGGCAQRNENRRGTGLL